MTSDQATIGAFLLGALAAAASAAVWVWPRAARFFRALDRMFETINGRPAQVDRSGRQQKPAVPSLSVQLSDIQATIADQTSQNEQIAALRKGQAALETIVAEHGKRLNRLDSGHQAERIAGHVANAAAFSAIEEAAKRGGTVDGDVVEEPDTEL